MVLNRTWAILSFCAFIMIVAAGCVSDSGPLVPQKTWLEGWDDGYAEHTRAVLVGGHARELADGEYEVRGYFVPFSSDFPANRAITAYFDSWGSDVGRGARGHVPAMDLAPGESYTLVSPPLYISGTIDVFTVDPDYDPIESFKIFCPFKDASATCELARPSSDPSEFTSSSPPPTKFLPGPPPGPSDFTEHLLYDRLGAWEMPTIDIIDLTCGGVLTGYQMNCTFSTWNWYDLTPADATLKARLRARNDGSFPAVQEWDIPFGAPLAHNDTRPYSIELGDALEWVADYQTNDFYVEIVAQRPDNAASMSHLMTHVLIHPVEELAR